MTFDPLRGGLLNVNDREALAMLPTDFFQYHVAATWH
jgi:hypothetical protein